MAALEAPAGSLSSAFQLAVRAAEMASAMGEGSFVRSVAL